MSHIHFEELEEISGLHLHKNWPTPLKLIWLSMCSAICILTRLQAKLKHLPDLEIKDGYIYKRRESIITGTFQERKSWKFWVPSDFTNNLIKWANIDFNLPRVTWSFCEDSGCMVASTTSDKAKLFLNKLFANNLLQYNRTRNGKGRLSDLCFATVPEIAVPGCLPFSLPEHSHHPVLRITLRNWHVRSILWFQMYL